jgi:hypothetical protein
MAANRAGEGTEAPGLTMPSAETVKTLGFVVFAFFAVLGLAGFLFDHHQRQRAAELDAELAQNAARLGREIELRYRNYRALVDNVTRLKTATGTRPEPADTTANVANTAPNVADYVDRLIVLPSHRPHLTECRQKKSVADAELCVAEQMRLLNDANGLEMVACPSSGAAPSLSPDGRYLVIPPSDGQGQPPACGRVKVRSLLSGAESDGAAVAPSDAAAKPFDTVLLLRKDGTTLRSLDFGSNLRLWALPGFDAKQAVASAVLPNLAIGTGKYRAFLQPVRLRLAVEGSPPPAADGVDRREHSDLIVCGLVREDALARASVQLSLPSYLWVVLLLGVGLLSLPLAKLSLIGSRATFRPLDATALTISALLLTLLGTVIILGFFAHNRLARRADDQIDRVGRELENRLRVRIRAAAAQLHEFTTAPATKPLLGLVGEGAPVDAICGQAHGSSVEHVPFADDPQGRSLCEKTGFQPAGVRREGWSLFFIVDGEGYERAKFVAGPRDSAAVSVKDRAYFKGAREQRTACLDPPGCTLHGVPELVRSITSGKMILVVAVPICLAEDACDQKPAAGVAAFQVPIDDLRSLTLPLGVQVAVIDANGQVMLHSNNDAHHEQNLFAEVDAPEELQAALAAGVSDTITLNYLGQPSRIHLEPVRLPGTGWSVLTITPSAVVDVATTDMVIASLLGYGALLALALSGTCAFLVARKLFRWVRGSNLDQHVHDHVSDIRLRPNAAHSREYAALGLATIRAGAVLSVVALLASRLLPTSVGLFAAVLVCLVAARRIPKLCHGNFGESSHARRAQKDMPAAAAASDVAKWRDFLPLTYLLCCAGLAEVFVMAPATVLFAGAYDHVADVLVRAEQQHFSKALGDKEVCLRALASGTQVAACAGVIGSGDEFSPPAAASPTWQYLRSAALDPIPYWLADLLPPVGTRDDAMAGRLYRSETLASPDPPASRYRSVREPTLVVLRNTRKSSPQGERLFATAVPALVGLPLHPGSLFLLLLVSAAVLGTSYVVGFHSLRRLFFLDVFDDGRLESPPSLAALLVELEQPEVVHRWLLVNAASTAQACLRQTGRCRDLPFDVPALGSSDDTPSGIWLVDKLDSWFEKDPEAVALRRASQLRASVVILAARNPLERLPAGHGAAWAGALEQFTVREVGPDAVTGNDPSEATLTRLWNECDETERQILAQLAAGNYVTPHPSNGPVLKALAARGLLDPNTLTLAHERLKAVALRGVTRREQEAWADADRQSAWTHLRVPLTAGVASLLAAVTIAKPELGVASAVVPTLAASLPMAVKLLVQMLDHNAPPGPSAGG